MRRHGVNPEDVEPPVDGVFRPAPSEGLGDAPHAVSQVRATSAPPSRRAALAHP
jgi:hypothetical protein